jgi:hypothetical protein
VSKLIFIREHGFPRRWSAVQSARRTNVGLITQDHERNEEGKSVFRYRAVLLPDRQLGLFATLRDAKQALTKALKP